MATNPATPMDIESRWRPLSNEEEIVASTLLDDAWRLLNRSLPDLASRMDANPSTVDTGDVKMVLANMVIRVLRNPDGYRQESIQDYAYTFDVVTASGRLTVTDDELALLASAASDLSASGAFSIVPTYRVPASQTAPDPSYWRWGP